MIRSFLVTTVLATLVATAAYAQQAPAPAPAPEPPKPVQADGYLASNYIGTSVYNGTDPNAQKIGKVNDILIDSKGTAKSIVIGVGGFLGIGEKNVAIDFPKLSWVEANGQRWMVTAASKEQLEAASAFDTTPYRPAPPPPASGGTMATPPATTPPANTSQ
ncbi:PRC-barrel domain-containing protein [Mesorhizobium sp. BAC0120]|uniref:PRC-barrel domain-containing protein n=1 Tax=Mesorhizobium sp. BAC0120 TaxID=3090670 RepID=UPI00298D5149|nr:PRC-barrel domain-containing protein [Mesorhizobium sp. BAC0120]MDW6020774.1 PRC-barrel domain-containing protein [Mesorhizobium sp. BAC0120]